MKGECHLFFPLFAEFPLEEFHDFYHGDDKDCKPHCGEVFRQRNESELKYVRKGRDINNRRRQDQRSEHRPVEHFVMALEGEDGFPLGTHIEGMEDFCHGHG